jgi:hypothetical protein
MKFTALLHHLTVELLREGFYSLKRKAAPGVDGVTWQEYEDGLENRLPFAAAARNTRSPGRELSPWPTDGFLNRECSILTPCFALPPLIRDKNRMR